MQIYICSTAERNDCGDTDRMNSACGHVYPPPFTSLDIYRSRDNGDEIIRLDRFAEIVRSSGFERTDNLAKRHHFL